MKVQNEMSTRISVETVSAIGSLSAFRNAIRATSNAWRAQETALKNSNNYEEAAAARLRGLNQVIDLQKAKVEELRSRQEGLDTSNQKQANQFLKLEKQIQQANRQLASYESQATRARSAARYQTSGLAALQHAYKQSQTASTAYVNRLTAEGRQASATVEKYRQLRSSLTNLQSQYQKQQVLLRQVAEENGKDSDAYVKQRMQLDKTATSIAKTRTEMRSMQSSVDRLQPTGINRIDSAIVKMRDNTDRVASRMSSAFDRMKDHMMGIGATAITVGGMVVSSVNKAAAVQKVMVENQNLMQTAGEKSAATQREVNQMYSDGEKYSVQYGVSQRTIAQGYQELIKRGYDGRQSLGAMKSILEAAKASGDSFNDTMDVTTGTLDAFNMRASTTTGMIRNTAKVSDILAKSADVTSTKFKSIGEAMNYAGATAHQTGISLKDTAAALGVLSNAHLEATQAGTGLQRVLTRLAAPTAAAKTAMKQYGLSIDDFRTKAGKLRSLPEIFDTINKHVPKAEQLQFFNKVFGQTAQNAAGILAQADREGQKATGSLKHVEDQLKTAYSEDYVGKLARKNMNSAKNSQDRFKYASQAIQIEIGRNMLPALSKASASMANAFGRKDTQRGLKVIASGLGVVAKALANFVTFIGDHTKTVEVFGATLLAAFGAAKLLDAIGTTRHRINDLRAVLSKIPRKKHTDVTVDTKSAQTNVKNVHQELDKVPKQKTSKVVVDNKSAKTATDATKRELDTIPKTKTSTVKVDSTQAVNNIKTVGTASQTAATTSKISFASIGMAAKTSASTIAMAFRANPLGMIVTGVQIAIQAFQLLYQHSKRFRKFVNGLASAAKSSMRKVGHWFSSTFKSVEKSQQKSNQAQQKANRANLRAWDNYGRQHNKTAQRHQRELERQQQASHRRQQRTVQQFWHNLERGWDNYWKQQSRRRQAQQKQEARYQRQRQKADQRAWQTMQRNASRGWKSIERDATNGAKRVGRWYDNLKRSSTRVVQSMARQHPRTFQSMYRVIQDRTRTWHDVVTGHWKRVGSDTERLAKDQSRANKDIFEDMYSTLNKKTDGWLGKVVDSWKDHMSKIGDAIEAGKKNAGHAMADLANGVLKPFKTLIDDIQSGINWVLDKIGASKLGGSWSAAIPTFATGTKENRDGLKKTTIGMVNDGAGAHWRELYSYKGKVGAFPNKKNFVTVLPKGMSILNGEDSHKWAQAFKIPGFANGVGDFFANLKDDVDDWTDQAEKIMAHPVEFMEHVFAKRLGGLSSGIKFAEALITHVPIYIAKQMVSWVKQQFETLSTSMDSNSTSPAATGDHRHWMKQAGIPESWFDSINYIVSHESGWRVNATNPGSGAYGLPQSLPGSKMAAAGRDWRTNPITQLKWMKSYVSSRYGGGPGAAAFWRSHHWYANGGLVSGEQIAHIAENNSPEMVIPLSAAKRGRAYQLLSEVMAQFKHEDSAAQPTRVDQPISQKDFKSLETKVDTLIEGISQLVQLGQQQIVATNNSGNKFGLKANRAVAYNVIGKDQRLNDYMSYRR